MGQRVRWRTRMCPAEEPEGGGGSAGPAPEPTAPDPSAAPGTPSADAAAEEIRKLRAQLEEERSTRLRLEETMQTLADEDGLTGVAGARRLDDRLALALVHARRQKHKLALVQLSLDGFQATVERLGRADADELLRCVAYALQTTLRQGDTIARLSSSDVFTIVLPGIDRDEDVTVIAEKLRLCLRTPFSIGGSSLFVTASIGIAVFPEDGSDPESLLQGAAHAMSRAQEKGGDAWDVHAPGSRARAVRRLTRETTLRRALVGDSLALYWRPALLCTTGALVGMEALLRWHGERARAACPEDFVSPRDVPNLAVPLGQWLFRRACREAA